MWRMVNCFQPNLVTVALISLGKWGHIEADATWSGMVAQVIICCEPGIYLQPHGDQRLEEIERGVGKDCFDRIVPDLVGSE